MSSSPIVTSSEHPVLLVDDDAGVREALSDFLVEEGHHVVAVGNGARALEVLDQGLRPSIILLDVMMPVMDGWDFRVRQLKNPELAAIPVAVVTASGYGTGTLLRLFGNVRVLEKPVDVERLLDTVRAASAAA